MRLIACLLVLVSVASADQWVSPEVKTVTSADGKRTAVITPSKDGARVVSGKRKLDLKWVPVDAVLLNDGSLLVLDQWHQLGFGKVATLFGPDGKLRWTKTLEQLVGKALVDRASHSVSSIWWRKVPLEWSLATDGKSGTITLFDENQLRLTIANGATELVAVPDLPADADRLLNRARSLANEPTRRTETIALLDRIIALDPDRLDAVRLEVELFQNAKEHDRVIALLDRVSPRWNTTTENTEIANICIVWSQTLVTLNRLPEAEQKLRLGVTAAPKYPNPALELARLLVKQKRPQDADVVIDEYVARLFAAPYLDTFGLANVAEYYERERVDWQKALAVYLKGYKKDEVTNQFLYSSLAELHEKLGNDAQAIVVHQQLLAHYTKLGSAFDQYAKETRAAIARLHAKPKKTQP